MDEKSLLKLKKQIEDSKRVISELTGKQNYLMNELMVNWECDSIDAADELLDTMQDTLTDLNAKIKEMLIQLEEKYEK